MAVSSQVRREIFTSCKRPGTNRNRSFIPKPNSPCALPTPLICLSFPWVDHFLFVSCLASLTLSLRDPDVDDAPHRYQWSRFLRVYSLSQLFGLLSVHQMVAILSTSPSFSPLLLLTGPSLAVVGGINPSGVFNGYPLRLDLSSVGQFKWIKGCVDSLNLCLS